MKDPGTLLIRADASVAMGSGHVMRCLALAQAWQDAGGKAVVATTGVTAAGEDRLRRENVEVTHLLAEAGSPEDAVGTTEVARHREATWVVVDGYQFDSAYQEKVRGEGHRLLVVDDDAHAGRYVADMVLNQNAHAAEVLYGNRAPYTRLLLGAKYAMLRREFRSWRGWQREIPATGQKILVTMGGSDPDSFTLRVLEALGSVECESLDVVVVAGGSNPHTQALEAAVAKARYRVRLVRNVENMPEVMAWADVAVSGAGATCWEICFFGLPALLVDLAKNQRPVAERLNELGAALHLGSSRECSTERIAREVERLIVAGETREQMSGRGRELVDGRGASRVCTVLEGNQILIRRAVAADCRLLWEWASDPMVRSSAFVQKAIGWEEHEAWFRAKMTDPACTILIGEDAEGHAVGQVRFNEKENGTAEIDVSVAREFRGGGYGSLLIRTAVRDFFVNSAAGAVHAFIRPENGASVRAFEKAGFHGMGEKQVKGAMALHYCCESGRRDHAARGST